MWRVASKLAVHRQASLEEAHLSVQRLIQALQLHLVSCMLFQQFFLILDLVFQLYLLQMNQITQSAMHAYRLHYPYGHLQAASGLQTLERSGVTHDGRTHG